MTQTLTGLTFFRVLCRSFLVQAVWNFERMQNVGFAFMAAPFLRVLYPDPDARRQALERHMAFFNTHPFFAPLIAGVIWSQEQAYQKRGEPVRETLTTLKNSMGGALGAIGDHIVWGTWRPFCAIAAAAFGFSLRFPQEKRRWVMGAVFLGLFNALHFWIRAVGLSQGFRKGPGVVEWIRSGRLQQSAAWTKRIGLLLLVYMVLGYFAWVRQKDAVWHLAVLLGAIVLKRMAVHGVWLLYAVTIAAFIMGKVHFP